MLYKILAHIIVYSERLVKAPKQLVITAGASFFLVLFTINLPGILVQQVSYQPSAANQAQFELNQGLPMAIQAQDNLASHEIDTEIDFSLQIPKIGLSKDIIPNVDPVRESVYGPVINQYVAHGKYTKLPDEATENGNVYLFAHREGQHNGKDIGFFKDLGEIALGDKAIVHFEGRKYTYEMYKKFVIYPKDVWVYSATANEPTLTLQTCENGTSQRLIVKFKLVDID